MKNTKNIKIAVDILITVMILLAMSYMLIGEKAHEYIGTFLIILFVVHNILNYRWYSSIFKGSYNINRVLHTIVNVCVVIFVVLLAISGIILSKYIFEFLPYINYRASAGKLHLFSAYWGFIFISLHLGFHWGIVAVNIRQIFKSRFNSRVLKTVLRFISMVVMIYGVYAMYKNHIFNYMFLINRFVFFDTEQPLVLFFVDYISIMLMWSMAGYYIKVFFNNRRMNNV